MISVQDKMYNSDGDNSIMENIMKDEFEQRFKQIYQEYQKKQMNI